jgi:hypothetical protein
MEEHSHIFLLKKILNNWLSLNQEMNESIPEPDDHNLKYPLYYDGTTSHDYKMACFVLGNKSVTIQDMNAVYSKDDAENEDLKMDIGNTAIGSIG